jgi:hypothetical protein
MIQEFPAICRPFSLLIEWLDEEIWSFATPRVALVWIDRP